MRLGRRPAPYTNINITTSYTTITTLCKPDIKLAIPIQSRSYWLYLLSVLMVLRGSPVYFTGGPPPTRDVIHEHEHEDEYELHNENQTRIVGCFAGIAFALER